MLMVRPFGVERQDGSWRAQPFSLFLSVEDSNDLGQVEPMCRFYLHVDASFLRSSCDSLGYSRENRFRKM